MAIYQFEYHTFLHHSQTFADIERVMNRLSTIHFYIILKLPLWYNGRRYQFEYHTFLHHSQTTGVVRGVTPTV